MSLGITKFSKSLTNLSSKISEQNADSSKNSLERKTFKTGVVNYGYEYEKQMPALLSLKLLFDKNIKDFELDLNSSSFKKFDNLVITVEYQNGKKEQFAVELKHRTKGRDVLNAEQEFCGKKDYRRNKSKHFDIAEYRNAYINEENAPKNCKFVLFTNTKFEETEKVSDFVIKRIKPPFPTDNTKDIYQFSEKVAMDKTGFYDNFYLFAEQKDTIETCEEIQNIFKNNFSSTFEAAICYMDFFQKLRNANFKDTKLTRDQLILNLSKFLLSNYFIFCPIKNESKSNIKLLESIIKIFDVTVLSSTDETFILNNWAFKEDLLNKSSVTEWATELKLRTETEKLVWHKDFFVQVCYYNKIVFLNFNEESKQTIASVVLLLKTLKEKKLHVVLVGKEIQTKEFYELSVFQNLKDVKKIDKSLYQKMIQNLKISLQGRIVSLGENDIMDEVITSDEVFHSLEGEVLIGEKIDDFSEHYISRTLSRSNIQISLLKNLCEERLAIVNYEGTVEELKQELLNQDFKSEITSCSNYQEKPSEYQESFLIHSSSSLFENEVNLLIDKPGSGKTTFMKYLAHQCPTNYWVVYISILENISIFKTEYTNEQLVEKFLSTTGNSSKYQYFLKTGQIVLLFDDLNKVNMSLINIVLNKIKDLAKTCKTWISSAPTPQLVSLLDQNFQPPYYYFLEKLKPEERKKYVEDRLTKANVTEETTNQWSNIILNTSETFLDLYLSTEILQKQEKNLNASQLFTTIVERRLQHFLKKTTNVDLDKTFLEIYRNYYICNYQRIGLRTCLEFKIFDSLKNVHVDKDFVEAVRQNRSFIEVKVDEKENLSFASSTFAEFFAATWLTENFNDVSGELRSFIFQEKYKGIRKFFDTAMAENCPLHLAVLDLDFPRVEKYAKTHFNDLDKGGRTAFHLAVSLGRKHKIFDKDEQISISNEEDFKEQEKILIYLLTLKVPFFQKDKLFGWNLFRYADASLCLWSLEELAKQVTLQWIYAPTFFENLSSLSYHCAANGYLMLLESIILQEESLDKNYLLEVAKENKQKKIQKYLVKDFQDDASLNKTGKKDKTRQGRKNKNTNLNENRKIPTFEETTNESNIDSSSLKPVLETTKKFCNTDNKKIFIKNVNK